MLVEHLCHAVHLQTNYGTDLFLAELTEVDYLVDTVKELRTDRGLHHTIAIKYRSFAVQLVHSEVAGHDYDGILEVYHSALRVSQSAVVKYL